MFEDREGAVAIRNSSDRPAWHEESFSSGESDFRTRSRPEPAVKVERPALPAPIVRKAVDDDSADAGAKSANATAPGHGIARKAALAAAVVAALAVGGWYGNHWWTFGRFIISTD